MKKIIIIFIFILPFLFFGVIWLAGSSLIAPVNQTVGNCLQDLDCENVEFKSESGAIIKSWFLRGEKGKSAIILMHGVRANRLDLIERLLLG